MSRLQIAIFFLNTHNKWFIKFISQIHIEGFDVTDYQAVLAKTYLFELNSCFTSLEPIAPKEKFAYHISKLTSLNSLIKFYPSSD